MTSASMPVPLLSRRGCRDIYLEDARAGVNLLLLLRRLRVRTRSRQGRDLLQGRVEGGEEVGAWMFVPRRG